MITKSKRLRGVEYVQYKFKWFRCITITIIGVRV